MTFVWLIFTNNIAKAYIERETNIYLLRFIRNTKKCGKKCHAHKQTIKRNISLLTVLISLFSEAEITNVVFQNILLIFINQLQEIIWKNKSELWMNRLFYEGGRISHLFLFCLAASRDHWCKQYNLVCGLCFSFVLYWISFW